MKTNNIVLGELSDVEGARNFLTNQALYIFTFPKNSPKRPISVRGMSKKTESLVTPPLFKSWISCNNGNQLRRRF